MIVNSSPTMLKVSMIAAMTPGNQVIGDSNKLPWKLPNDMKRFQELTVGKSCIMGRKTCESLPDRFRPLPNRQNIVMTRDKEYQAKGAIVRNDISYIDFHDYNPGELMIIGGSEIYKHFMDAATSLYITFVHGVYDGDAYFPQIGNEWTLRSMVNHAADDKHAVPYSFAKFTKFSASF